MKENISKNDVNDEIMQAGFRRQKLQQVSNEEIQRRLNHHKLIMKKLNNTARAYQKISKSYFCNKFGNKEIKTGMILLSQNLQSQYFSGLSHKSCKNALEIIYQTNSSLSDHCQEYYGQINNLVSMYAQLVKNKNQKYSEQRQNVDHYVKKIHSLSREREQQKYQRNKSKLTVARADFDRITNDFHNFLGKINEQAEKIWQNNFVKFTTIFVIKFGETFEKIKQLIEKHRPIGSDQILIDQEEEDFNYRSSLSPKINESAYQKISLDINQFLIQKSNYDQSIVIDQAFKSKIVQSVNKISNQNKVKNLTINPNISKLDFQNIFEAPPKSNTIKQAKTLMNYIPQKNDFSVFDNILSSKQQEITNVTRNVQLLKNVSTPTDRKNHDSHFNFISAQPPLPQKKQNTVNLLDL